jgi:orotate phosphoribosyltransferase
VTVGTANTPSLDDRASLKKLLLEKSVRFGEFTLVSGQKSSVYVDSKPTAYFPQAMPLIGRAVLRVMEGRGWRPDAVGGLTLGADPIAFAVARESLEKSGSPILAFVIRKEPKKHGTQKYVEGLDETNGLRAVIIDDVCTTGGSTAQAIRGAQAAGMHVLGAVCLVDREMGAGEMLGREFGCALESVFRLSDLAG